MAKGTVKWFNPIKGYGFVAPENGGKDVFVHISEVPGLKEGETVSFELERGRNGKEAAVKLAKA